MRNHAGKRNPNAVLTPLLVREIRNLRSAGWSYGNIVKHLEGNVTRSCVQKVCNGSTWKQSTRSKRKRRLIGKVA